MFDNSLEILILLIKELQKEFYGADSRQEMIDTAKAIDNTARRTLDATKKQMSYIKGE